MQVAPGAWRYALLPILVGPPMLVISVPAGTVLVFLGVAVLAFFRDPDRSPPSRGVVAPADGRISVLRPEGDRVRVGVFMNVWNVHVVRAPTAETVVEVEHTPGAHRPAFSKDSDRNERVHVRFGSDDPDAGGAGGTASDGTDDVDGTVSAGGDRIASDGTGSVDVAPSDGTDGTPSVERAAGAVPAGAGDVDLEVTLIAGAFARRITPYVEPGDAVERGDRLGHIAFGSRVDVLLPPSVDVEDVAVDRGSRVRAGETVLLEPHPSARRETAAESARDVDVSAEPIEDGI